MAPNRGNYRTEIRREDGADLAVYDFGIVPEHRRILVLKLDHVGDFLIALPALQSLRRIFSTARITLVCGPWNAAMAQASGIADEIRTYAFFTEVAPQWKGRPVEDLQHFREAAAGHFDIALDLRVDEDTRFLLKHVEATLKCGIGGRDRHPFLDVILPAEFEDRRNPPFVLVQPHRFQSRMPVRTAFFHETDFSVSNTHLIYGPDLALPAGRYRANWGLQLKRWFPRLGRLQITVDVALAGGDHIIAAQPVSRQCMADLPSDAAIEFINPEPGARYEFRVHARGRPGGTRLRFFGVWVEDLDRAVSAPLRRAELHTGESLSLLVQLIAERTRQSQPAGLPLDKPPTASAPAAATELPASAKRVVIAPLSNKQTCDWGLANYARLVRALLEQTACAILLVGSAAQRDQIEAVLAANAGDRRIINLAGRTDWLETADIIGAADLVISNNSGIAHLAAACGTPILGVYSASHQAEEWGPRGAAARVVTALVPCSPCGYDRLPLCPNDYLCMQLVRPERVAAEAIAMLSSGRPPP